MSTKDTRPEVWRKTSGFSLVEMAIVLAIVGLLLAGLLPSITGQIEQQRRNETRKLLDEIKDALTGYAIINGKLPCPATIVPGEADNTCTSPTSDHFLPWKTLGVPETDPWGGKWLYRVEPAFASSVPFTLTTTSSPTLDLQVRDSAGNRITTANERPLTVIYSTGPNRTPDGQNASFETTSNATYQSDTPSQSFDDITIWISRPQLFNRMVAAGKLP